MKNIHKQRLVTLFHSKLYINKSSYLILQGWVVNMIPWLTIPIFTFAAKALNEHLMSRRLPTTRIRKIVQSICFAVQCFALFMMCHTTSFPLALLCMSIITGKLFDQHLTTV